MFGWIRKWKRKKYLRRDFPTHWIPILKTYLPFYPQLPQEQQDRFHDLLKVFAWEKHFIGAKGLRITDEIRVVISGLAVRLILHLDLSYYNRLTEIVVYPHHYKHKDENGIMLGEAHHWGTVVLSWPAVLEGIRNPCDGHDTALHEFAHVLDRGSGRFNGTPKLRAGEHYRAWGQVMSTHFLRLQNRYPRERMLMRPYGGKNEAEFFAVATESFFERPLMMQKLTPSLYEELKRFYGLDPAQDPTCGIREFPKQ